jgi:LacI family transcriptional regulator
VVHRGPLQENQGVEGRDNGRVDAGPMDGGRVEEAPVRQPSLTDVARLAGVSPSTASRALDAGRLHPVAGATRVRVEQAARQLGYRPNPLARGLRAKPTNTMAVVVPDFIHPYFGQLVRGVGRAAADAGYLTIHVTAGKPELELRYLDMLQSQRVAAVLFATAGTGDDHHREAVSAQVRAMRAYGGAVVALSQRAEPWPAEVVDEREGARVAVRHLVELGHRRVAAIIGPETLQVNVERVAGYGEAMREAGLEPARAVSCNHDGPSAANAVGELLERGVGFTALFAASDAMAIGVMTELHHRGLRVPEDVSVIGYGGLLNWEQRKPALTTVRVFPTELGAAGVRRALDQLSGRDRPPRVRYHPVELVVRESTRRPAVAPV